MAVDTLFIHHMKANSMEPKWKPIQFYGTQDDNDVNEDDVITYNKTKEIVDYKY